MTSTAQSANLEYALMLGRMGFKEIPCCWPGPTGACACPKRHGGTPQKDKEIGKAPLTTHGLNDATADPTVIKRLWSTWPQANVAIDLTGYIMVDPDSEDAQLEAEELGLPPTLKRLSDNDAYIYKAPDGLPIARLTHRGKTGMIDVFSGGYCLVYGKHRTGCDISLQDLDIEPADAPQWVLDWINEWAEAKAKTAETVAANHTEDISLPPVRLRPTAMEWWEGKKTRRGPEGIDRSETLYQIGIFLARANASATVIAYALAERDTTLGYAKFSDRKDAAIRYTEMAERAIAAQSRDDEPSSGGSNGNRNKEADSTEPVYQLQVFDAMDIDPRPVGWLWQNRIPAGKFSILAGDPGLGKSYLTLDLAARISVGGPWPDGSRAPQGNTLIISVEDGLHDTIRPRLDNLGADLRRIRLSSGMVRSDDDRKSLSLVDHLEQLETEIVRFQTKLSILDPILAFTGSKDTHRSSDVRAVLAPLAEMADRTGCAILAIIHLNKKSGEFNSIYRLTGSLDFAAAARSIMFVAKHPDKEDRRVFVVGKANLSTVPEGLNYSIQAEGAHGVFAWGGISDIDANDLLNQPSGEDRSARREAIDFLIAFLESGDRPSREVLDAAQQNAINDKTLRRAAKDIGVHIYQSKTATGTKGSPGWMWGFIPPEQER